MQPSDPPIPPAPAPLRPERAPPPVSGATPAEPLPGADPALRRRALLGAASALALGACAAQRGRPGAPAVAPASGAEAGARRAERLADLRDDGPALPGIDAQDRSARRARLARALAERGLDAYLCEPGPTMTYLAGVSWGRSERLFALVVTADGGAFWIVPAFEETKARHGIDGTAAAPGPGGDVVTWREDEYAFRPLCDALRARGVKRLAIDPGFRFGFVDRIAQAARADAGFGALAEHGAIVSGADVLVRLRGCKEPKELALLRRANELTKRALERIAHELRPGQRGADVGALVATAHERLGFSGSWCLPLVGAAAALPHGDAGATPLADGEVLLVDCGGAWRGYQSDVTRTWVPFGAPSADVERAWRDVRDAQRAAFDAIRPGVPCRAVDAAARAAIAARGWPGGFGVFTHRLGHGIGLEGHEDPYFDGGSQVELESGMTLSNEPGIYLPGRFGVRIEDVIVVTRDGADVFGAWQSGLRSPAGA
ncbi:MAG: aminopeptidase P family protein [Planctomycetes bacterium]|nr:aminopeptidase P family protein [Planctomycetota bacterium]